MKHKGYSFINIFGLALGLATCIIIFLYVQDELSFDRFHRDAQNIFRWETAWEENGEKVHWAASAGGWIPRLLENYPEIVAGAKINKSYFPVTFRNGERQFTEKNIYSADASFFEVFDFETITPNPQSFLTDPGTVVLTESTAKKYFGEENPIGKTLDTDRQPYTVTGVIKDIPTNSHFHFDLLLSMETLRTLRPDVDQDGPLAWHSYFRVKNKIAAFELKQKLQKDIYKMAGFTITADSTDVPEGYKLNVAMTPITDIHLHSHAEKELEANSDIKYVHIFSLIAIFILLIAGINYMNLATAKSSKRAREVGIRKTLGSDKKSIFYQFMGESFLLCLISLLIALVLVELILPKFNIISGKELHLDVFQNFPLMILLITIWLVIGFLSGSYPAIFMTGFKPVTILNSNNSTSSGSKSALLFRRILVVTQFAISILLIISAITVYKQLIYIHNKNLGFDKEQVIVLPRPRGQEDFFKEELYKLPEVVAASVTSTIPGERVPYLTTRMPSLAGKQNNYTMGEDGQLVLRVWGADEDIEETLGLTIVKGRGFDKEHTSDREQAFILNEAAVKALNLENPIGKEFYYEYNLEVPKEGKIIGVVKDFHYASLHSKVEPLVMHYYPPYDMHLCIRLQTEDMKKSLRQIKNTWDENISDIPFEVQFLYESYDSLYKAEMNMGKIIFYFTFLAIVIACLGLFGLAAFVAEQRTKEIAIRKILGASIFKILGYLSQEFILLVLIANLIAWIPAYFFLTNWLQNFAYHEHISLFIFLISGISAVFIALLTVIFQAYRAAIANPATALKYE